MLLSECTFTSIDLETTGLDPRSDEIVSYASVPMRGGRILAGQAAYLLIKPASFNISAMKYHGISHEDLKSAPTFGEAADSILATLQGLLVGHSVEFDYRILVRFFKQVGMKLERDIVDIILVEKWLCRKAGKMSMDLTFEAMMERYSLKESYRHNSLADAFFTAQMFQKQLQRLSERGIDTVKGLQKAMKSYRYALW